MRIPPDAPLELQRCLRDIQDRLDRLGSTHGPNTNMAGKRVINASPAERFGEYVTLEQVIDMVRRAAGTTSAAATTVGDPGTNPDTGSPPDGGGSGGGPPAPPGPPGTGTCTSQPLSAALPGWFSAALFAAGQATNQNCFDPALLLAIEATCNANDFTLQRDSGCNVRGRLYHQANHGLWGTFCGQPDASAVEDYHVDCVITNSDGTVSWGWV